MALTANVISTGISARAAKQAVNRFRQKRLKAFASPKRGPEAPAIVNSG
jgi:hypothetical protein